MASRMERYYKQDTMAKRSARNQELYKSIYEENDYSDVEIKSNTKTIDLEELKMMLDNKHIEKKDEKKVVSEINQEEEKSYDLNYILDQARSNKVADDKKRSLSDTQYNILKKINIKKEENKDLKDLIDTITTKSLINEDRDLFEDLKSLDNTSIGIPSELNDVFKENKEDFTKTMDETFFTKSMKLNPKDFDTLNSNLERNNKMMKIIFILIIIVIIIILGIIIFSLI